MTQKSEQILAENPQLKKRMVKGELKRKLLKHSSAIPDKVMKPMELDLEMRESSQSGSVSDGIQIRMSLDGNQESESLQEGARDRAGLLTDCYQTGYFGGISEAYFPLEQPFSEVQISENHHPIRQAEDDWSIQESNQEPEPVGNLPYLGCLGID